MGVEGAGRRRVLPTVALVVEALLLAACSSASPSPSPAPTADVPAGPLTVGQLLSTPAAFDGRLVIVRTGYWSRGGAEQYLTDGFLESYPPQPMQTLLLVGDLPDDVAARLDSTEGEPGLAFAVWGQVEALGVFHAAAGAAEPWLELREIRIFVPS
jgi:hypothetical protein